MVTASASDSRQMNEVQLISFGLAIGIVLILALITSHVVDWLAPSAGVSEALSKVLVYGINFAYVPALKVIQERIEATLRQRRGMSLLDLRLPTRPLWRTGVFGLTFVMAIQIALPLVVGAVSLLVGIYFASTVQPIMAVFSDQSADPLKALDEFFGEVQIYLPIVLFLGSGSFVLGQVLYYLTGEWIGRSLDSRDRPFTLIVASLCSLVSGALYYAITMFSLKSALVTGLTPEEAAVFQRPEIAPIVAKLNFILKFWVGLTLLNPWIVVSLGALRGAQYKEYFDLAYYSQRLGVMSREKIGSLLVMLRDDYLGVAVPEPKPPVVPRPAVPKVKSRRTIVASFFGSSTAPPPVIAGIAGAVRGVRQNFDQATITLGASPENAFHIRGDPAVSRRHASLTRDGQRFILRDLGSKNGTYCNGRSLKGEAMEIRLGDQFQMGESVLMLQPPENGPKPNA